MNNIYKQIEATGELLVASFRHLTFLPRVGFSPIRGFKSAEEADAFLEKFNKVEQSNGLAFALVRSSKGHDLEAYAWNF